ncbi:MAG: VOC family protein [Actinomycetota bacterium]|nr:VOC family protein [Actinomycetota bacterium]
MRFAHGQFGWADLMSTDVEASRALYEGLFGWESRIMPTDVGPDYTIFTRDGQMVAGMGPQPPDMPPGTPSTWSAYVMVDDVDQVTAKAESAGGFVAMPAMDVMTQGRMAMIGDPSGAVVGLWQPNEHRGAEVTGEPGSVAWNELQTRNLAGATAFYATLFDWEWNDFDGSGYQVATLQAKEGDDKTVAGAMTMPDGVPAEAPSMWLVYFAVGSCDESVEQAAELGATVFLPPMTMGPGRFAGLTDPAGAMFMVGHFDEPEPA